MQPGLEGKLLDICWASTLAALLLLSWKLPESRNSSVLFTFEIPVPGTSLRLCQCLWTEGMHEKLILTGGLRECFKKKAAFAVALMKR